VKAEMEAGDLPMEFIGTGSGGPYVKRGKCRRSREHGPKQTRGIERYILWSSCPGTVCCIIERT
jgi:hypothetical protein